MNMSITNDYGNYGYYGSTASNITATEKNKDDQPVMAKPENQGVVYEKQSEVSKDKATYDIASKSPADRAAIVQQLKAAEEDRRNQLMAIVQKTLQGQVGAYGKATGDDFWRQLAGGNFKVDSATRAQAQKDISEDGYYGVKQTSQRLFDFAQALAGDDVDKMKEMQKAMEKGFKQATKTWGKELPSICKETINAANKLFEDYYNSKSSVTTETNDI